MTNCSQCGAPVHQSGRCEYCKSEVEFKHTQPPVMFAGTLCTTSGIVFDTNPGGVTWVDYAFLTTRGSS